MELSNREWAALIWLSIFIIGVFSYRQSRGAAWEVVKAFFHRAILSPLGIAGVYIAGCVWLLQTSGLWTTANLKATLLWGFSFAFLSMINSSKIDEDARYFRKVVKETIALTVVITFLIDTFTFSLLTEVLLVPFLTVVTAMQVVGQGKPEHSKVTSLMTWILAISGGVFLAHAGIEAVMNFRSLTTFDNGREFITPIILSLVFLPFLYLLNIYQVYNRIFSSLRWTINDAAVGRYAKWRAFLTFGNNLPFLKRWRRLLQIESPESRRDINRLFAELRVIRRRERHPPIVPSESGWSPYLARDFLASEGLTTEDYHRSFDIWQAASCMEKIDKTYSLSTIAYYVEGNSEAATQLRLKMHIFDSAEADVKQADIRFGTLTGKLLIAAIGMQAAQNLGRLLDDAETFDHTQANCRIRLEKGVWGLPNRSGYERIFIVSKGSQ